MNIITIGIPTFNRALILKDTLDEMIEERIHLIPGVEIMVRDNDSPDETYDILREYKAKYNVSISKNARNYGPSENCGGLLKSCTSDYFLLTSDEDPVLRSGLLKIMNIISTNSFAFASTIFMDNSKIYRGLQDGIYQIPPSHFHLSSFYMSGLVFNTGLALSAWKQIQSFLYDPRNAYPMVCLASVLIAKYGCYYFPIELCHELRESDFMDMGIGDYRQTKARLDQDLFRKDFFRHLINSSVVPPEIEMYTQMNKVEVYRWVTT